MIRKLMMAVLLLTGIVGENAFAQSTQSVNEAQLKDWQLLDYQTDSIFGTGVNKAYNNLLKGKKAHRVIVAVIDCGVDTAQEDLKGHIWTNPGEIAGNGKDDDHNGHVDDMHGWNFLGGKDGRSVVKESDELTREYFRLRNKYANISDSAQIKDSAEYALWQKIKATKMQDSLKTATTVAALSRTLPLFENIDSVLKNYLGKDTVYEADIDSLNSANDTIQAAKQVATRIFENVGPGESFEGFVKEGYDYLDGQKSKLKMMGDDPNATRKEIVGDNPNDINDTDYGNNNITGTFDMHGTHVAGIIAANRDNSIGMDGITDSVMIMPVKVVPDGDERDKDIALGIKYAVNNGAKVINMSFGKAYSPGKQWVDDAVKYAAQHNVLLIHAAGNDAADDDTVGNFPNPVYKGTHTVAPDFITVGASGPTDDDGELAASFSNYGKKSVDLFAPGVNIYSTVPDNHYKYLSGTSMATPVVSGIAALILEYYPGLSAEQVKYCLIKSATPLDSEKVSLPGGDQTVAFSSLSKSGGIVNAYKALKIASTLKADHRVKKKKHRSGLFRSKKN